MPPAALKAMMGKYSKNLTPKKLAKMKKDQQNQRDFTTKCYMDDGLALLFAYENLQIKYFSMNIFEFLHTFFLMFNFYNSFPDFFHIHPNEVNGVQWQSALEKTSMTSKSIDIEMIFC